MAEEQTPTSEVLSTEQVEEIVNPTEGAETTDPVLPSEVPKDEEGNTLIGGKFKSQDDLLKAYHELEKKFSQGTPPEETPPTETPSEETPSEGETTPPKPEDVDPDYAEYKARKELDKMLGEGGYDTYMQATEWAKENMSEEERKEYSDSLEGATPLQVKMMAENIINRMNSAGSTSTPTTFHSGEGSKPHVTEGYTTKSAMMTDMSDSRYKTDPSYRAKVEAKIAATDTSTFYSSLPSW